MNANCELHGMCEAVGPVGRSLAISVAIRKTHRSRVELAHRPLTRLKSAGPGFCCRRRGDSPALAWSSSLLPSSRRGPRRWEATGPRFNLFGAGRRVLACGGCYRVGDVPSWMDRRRLLCQVPIEPRAGPHPASNGVVVTQEVDFQAKPSPDATTPTWLGWPKVTPSREQTKADRSAQA